MSIMGAPTSIPIAKTVMSRQVVRVDPDPHPAPAPAHQLARDEGLHFPSATGSSVACTPGSGKAPATTPIKYGEIRPAKRDGPFRVAALVKGGYSRSR